MRAVAGRARQGGFKKSIGVGTRVLTLPLPPNHTGGSTASGSPVSLRLIEASPPLSSILRRCSVSLRIHFPTSLRSTVALRVAARVLVVRSRGGNISWILTSFLGFVRRPWTKSSPSNCITESIFTRRYWTWTWIWTALSIPNDTPSSPKVERHGGRLTHRPVASVGHRLHQRETHRLAQCPCHARYGEDDS